MKSLKILFFLSLIIWIWNLQTEAQEYREQIRALDEYIQEAIQLWQPPGLAITIVKDQELLFQKGYGTRLIGQDLPVNEHTLFVCASTTKAFTAAALAMLVDEGKVDWDDKVIDHLPHFRLSDPYITSELTVRDLLTHRSGMGNADFLWTFMDLSPDTILYKMRQLEPAYSLRAGYIYQNIMYLAAGEVVEKASGIPWGTFLKERIYEPLGMSETYAFKSQTAGQDNKSEAHEWIKGEIIRIEQSEADSIGPAGSMWSSVSDMSKWIRFLLDSARINGQTLIQPDSYSELFTPQHLIPAQSFYPSCLLTRPHWTSYGLGWFQHDYRGKMVQFHTGSLSGMVAILGMIPEEGIGVYIMANLDHVEIRHALMYAVFDLLLEGEITRDWSRELKALYDRRAAESAAAKPKRIENTTPAVEIGKNLGNYTNPIYGKVTLSEVDGTYRLNVNDKLKGSLEHWNYDTYLVAFDKKTYGERFVTFSYNPSGKVKALELMGREFQYLLQGDK